MAYPKIIEMLVKRPAVKAAGILMRAVFRVSKHVRIPTDNCV